MELVLLSEKHTSYGCNQPKALKFLKRSISTLSLFSRVCGLGNADVDGTVGVQKWRDTEGRDRKSSFLLTAPRTPSSVHASWGIQWVVVGKKMLTACSQSWACYLKKKNSRGENSGQWPIAEHWSTDLALEGLGDYPVPSQLAGFPCSLQDATNPSWP